MLTQQIVNQGVLSFGQDFAGTITAPAEAHEYTFNGTAGQRIWIDSLSHPSVSTSSSGSSIPTAHCSTWNSTRGVTPE